VPDPTENDLEAITEKFNRLTQRILDGFERQLQLAQASNDKEAVIKEQIKISVLSAARSMYAGCYLHVRKERPWPDQAP
jgi:hypothetical protein